MTDRKQASAGRLERYLGIRVPWCELAELPTPVHALSNLTTRCGLPEAFTKRDDLTSPIYGGNKVRTLEPLFGEALAQGKEVVCVPGACGSHYALATAMHAPRVGLRARALVFPQPMSEPALANLRQLSARAEHTTGLSHWSALPGALLAERRRMREVGESAALLDSGGATPRGLLGYVAAAFELGEQIHSGLLPRPEVVVVGVGSTTTSAGLLLGFWLASRVGRGFRERGAPCPPRVRGIRIAPRAVANQAHVILLARRGFDWLASLSCGRLGSRPDFAELARLLQIDGRQLGRGYGVATEEGRRAVRLWHDAGLNPLETTYSGKVAAGFLDLLRAERTERALFWSTKSSVEPPPVSDEAVRRKATPVVRAWIQRAEAQLGLGANRSE